MSDEMKTRIFSLLVDDQPGVMQRISMVFGRRGINIDSITVGRSTIAGKSRIILLFRCNDELTYLMKALLSKLVQVKDVDELDYESSILRELALVKVRFPGEDVKLKIMKEIDEYGARILYVGINYLILEVSGDSAKVQKFLNEMDPKLKIEVIRSGLAAMPI
ncbi:MAG: acetolactate synthase small subunit [Candidatus Bathyarchaeia archaeon]